MRTFKNSFFYISVISASTLLVFWIASRGKLLEEGRQVIVPDKGASQWMEFVNSITHNLSHPLAI